jgi:hypothetical protein
MADSSFWLCFRIKPWTRWHILHFAGLGMLFVSFALGSVGEGINVFALKQFYAFQIQSEEQRNSTEIQHTIATQSAELFLTQELSGWATLISVSFVCSPLVQLLSSRLNIHLDAFE